MILDVLGMLLLTLQTTPINSSVKFDFVLKLDYFGVIYHLGPISKPYYAHLVASYAYNPYIFFIGKARAIH